MQVLVNRRPHAWPRGHAKLIFEALTAGPRAMAERRRAVLSSWVLFAEAHAHEDEELRCRAPPDMRGFVAGKRLAVLRAMRNIKVWAGYESWVFFDLKPGVFKQPVLIHWFKPGCWGYYYRLFFVFECVVARRGFCIKMGCDLF